MKNIFKLGIVIVGSVIIVLGLVQIVGLYEQITGESPTSAGGRKPMPTIKQLLGLEEPATLTAEELMLMENPPLAQILELPEIRILREYPETKEMIERLSSPAVQEYLEKTDPETGSQVKGILLNTDSNSWLGEYGYLFIQRLLYELNYWEQGRRIPERPTVFNSLFIAPIIVPDGMILDFQVGEKPFNAELAAFGGERIGSMYLDPKAIKDEQFKRILAKDAELSERFLELRLILEQELQKKYSLTFKTSPCEYLDDTTPGYGGEYFKYYIQSPIYDSVTATATIIVINENGEIRYSFMDTYQEAVFSKQITQAEEKQMQKNWSMESRAVISVIDTKDENSESLLPSKEELRMNAGNYINGDIDAYIIVFTDEQIDMIKEQEIALNIWTYFNTNYQRLSMLNILYFPPQYEVLFERKLNDSYWVNNLSSLFYMQELKMTGDMREGFRVLKDDWMGMDRANITDFRKAVEAQEIFWPGWA